MRVYGDPLRSGGGSMVNAYCECRVRGGVGVVAMLWRLEKSDVYLLASIHGMDSAPPELSPQTELAYSQARRIAFEADLNANPDPSIYRVSAGARLSERVPPSLYIAVRERCAEVGLPHERLDDAQLWFAALFLMVALGARRGITVENGVDKLLWRRAASDGKQIVTLESIDDQLKAYASAPAHEQIRFLSFIAENTKASQADLDAMIAAWRARDEKPFEEILKDRLRRFPRGFGALVTERNLAWLPQIAKMAGDGIPTLVVVGAIHCVGDVGLPHLLAQMGRAVSRAD